MCIYIYTYLYIFIYIYIYTYLSLSLSLGFLRTATIGRTSLCLRDGIPTGRPRTWAQVVGGRGTRPRRRTFAPLDAQAVFWSDFGFS